MPDKQLNPIAYMVIGKNAQLRASSASYLQSIREEQQAAFQTAHQAYREIENQLLEAVRLWREAPSAERALAVGELQKKMALMDADRTKTFYSKPFLQQLPSPPVFLGKRMRYVNPLLNY